MVAGALYPGVLLASMGAIDCGPWAFITLAGV
jgi:hypothetical protein